MSVQNRKTQKKNNAIKKLKEGLVKQNKALMVQKIMRLK